MLAKALKDGPSVEKRVSTEEPGQSSSAPSEIVKAPESDSCEMIMLEDWNGWRGPALPVAEPVLDSEGNTDSVS